MVKYREKENQKKLIEQFSSMIIAQQSSLLRPLSIELEVPPAPQMSMEESEDQRRRQHLAKLEAGLRMRDLYTQQQRRWEEFREAERQRRVEKAKQKELDRLAGILSESVARRHYCQEQFQYSTVVRSYHHAARIIQRSFRQLKKRRQLQRMKEDERRRRAFQCKNRAAKVIQRAWRRYIEWKVYVARNFKSIKTGPVVKLEPSPLNPPPYWKRSYERRTIVSG